MNVYFKKVIICFCIIGFLFAPLRPQPVKAIAVVDDVIVIGGVVITVYACVLLLEKAGQLHGYEFSDIYSSDIRDCLSKKILSLTAAEIAKYFFTTKDSSGKDYVALTDDGYQWDANWMPSFTNADDPIWQMEHGTNATSSVTSYPSTPQPYQSGKYYMIPYTVTDGVPVSFFVSANDTLYYKIQYSSGSSTTYLDHVGSTGENIRFYISGSTVSLQSHVSDWINLNTKSCAVGSTVYLGYYTDSGSVSLPASYAITDTGIETGVKQGDAVAVPISGQYDSAKDQTIYAPIDGVATAGVVTGLKAIDNTGTNTGAGTDTQTGFWDKLWDWLKEIIDGITSIPSLILKWFTIDWDKVKTHINYIDIVKQHFQPISDIFDLISNVSADIKDSDGKFYMIIPHEMGGDDQEHCVLDLSVGAVYITTARDVIKYGMWMGFVWYVFRKFDPKFSI